MKIQSLILWAIVSNAVATSASAQQVEVISDAAGAEKAGFSQPYENRAHPKPTESDDFNDADSGTKSLKVTLTDTGYVSNPGEGNPPSASCNSTVTPSCGGFGGVAYEIAGVTDSIDDIVNMGAVSFDFYDDSNLSQPISLKVGCYTNTGMNADYYRVPRPNPRSNDWERAEVDMGSVQFTRGGTPGWTSTLATAPDFCPTGRDKKFQIFVSVGDRTYNPDPDEAHYFDRFKMGDDSPIYDFDLIDGTELPDTLECSDESIDWATAATKDGWTCTVNGTAYECADFHVIKKMAADKDKTCESFVEGMPTIKACASTVDGNDAYFIALGTWRNANVSFSWVDGFTQFGLNFETGGKRKQVGNRYRAFYEMGGDGGPAARV